MWKLSQKIIDYKDDSDGEVFKEIFPTFESIPEVIKQASVEEPKDHEYAVIIDDNGNILRKFAMHDAGNTLLSLYYLKKVATSLPDEVVKVAKDGLYESVQRFKVKLPKELKEIGSKDIPVVTRERDFKGKENLIALQDIADGRSPNAGEVIKGKTLLDGKYPVDDYYQVKKAEDYWQSYWREFKPSDRKQYATKLAQRMKELCLEIPEDVLKYASTGYSYDVDNHLQLRKDLVDDKNKQTVELLMEKRSYVDPMVFAEALEIFDKSAGLDVHWDSLLSDPYRATFGDTLEKVADDNWRHNADGQLIREDHLEALTKYYPDLKRILGSELANDFMKSPKSTFEKLSPIHKTMITRRASQEIL